MAGLPWFRVDSHIATHDKIIRLMEYRNGSKAFAMMLFGIGWSVGHGTDGVIPLSALPYIHGTKSLGNVLVMFNLWEEIPGKGWLIPNFEQYQQGQVRTKQALDSLVKGARRGGCKKNHPQPCECWKDEK